MALVGNRHPNNLPVGLCALLVGDWLRCDRSKARDLGTAETMGETSAAPASNGKEVAPGPSPATNGAADDALLGYDTLDDLFAVSSGMPGWRHSAGVGAGLMGEVCGWVPGLLGVGSALGFFAPTGQGAW